jgi:hypothetical protein
MLVGIEAHEVSSFIGNLNFPLPAYHCGVLRGEASIIIKGLQPTPSSVRSSLAPASGGSSYLALAVRKVTGTYEHLGICCDRW